MSAAARLTGRAGPVPDPLVPRKVYTATYNRRLRYSAWYVFPSIAVGSYQPQAAGYLTLASLGKSAVTPAFEGNRSRSRFTADDSLPAMLRVKHQDCFKSGCQGKHVRLSVDVNGELTRVGQDTRHTLKKPIDTLFLLSNIAPEVDVGVNCHRTPQIDVSLT